MTQQHETLIVAGLFDEAANRHPMLGRLDALSGTWVATGDYFDGQQTYPDRKAVHTYEWTCAGQILVWKILSHGPLKFYQSHSAIGWDGRRGCYRAAYYDNLGTMDQLTAHWADEHTLEMSFDSGFAFLGPQVKRLRNLIHRQHDGTQRWRLEADRGAGWEAIIVQTAYKLF